MNTRKPTQNWGSNAIPASLLSVMLGVPGTCAKESPRPPKGYPVESSNRVLLLGASSARRARRWSMRRSPRPSMPPAENIAAIRLLDSWLSAPEVDNSERAEEMRRRIDENRLSDRKFFT